MPIEIEGLLKEIKSDIKDRFETFERHYNTRMDAFESNQNQRLDRVESAIHIIGIDNKDHSTKIAEHGVKIEKLEGDCDNLGQSTRLNIENVKNQIIEKENQCSISNKSQHETLFAKVNDLYGSVAKHEQKFAWYTGALAVIGVIIPIILFIAGKLIK